MLNPEEQAQYDALKADKARVTGELRRINAALRTLYNRRVARERRAKGE